jgi:hypothetical protein
MELKALSGFFVLLAMITAASSSMAVNSDYTIVNRMELLLPVDLSAMNTDYQQARLVSQNSRSAVVEITYKPFYQPTALKPNLNWRADNLANPTLAPFLRPGVTANWDADFRRQLLTDLKNAGIDSDRLSDVELVQRVSLWLTQNFMGSAPFIALFVDFKDGVPFVPQNLRGAFDQQKRATGLSTDEAAFARGLFGKDIYKNHSAASCTPSAILWTTVFRALGIPTRIISNIPAVDVNDAGQILAAERAIHDPSIQQTTFLGFSNFKNGGFVNHTFNEVYVGGRWARLNYQILDQPIVDQNYMGLLTQIRRMNDWSEAHVASTWGLRFAVGQNNGVQPALSSVNPYRSLGMKDSLNTISLPPVKVTATPLKAWVQSSSLTPSWLNPAFTVRDRGVTQIAISISEPVQKWNFVPLRVFSFYASPKLVLKIPGRADVIGTAFAARFYYRPEDIHGYIVNFPIDPSEIPVDAEVTISAPADNDPNFHWMFSAPIALTMI